MEPLEAAQRLRHHVGVILALLLAGVVIPLILHAGDGKTYVSTARLLMGGGDTSSAEESNVAADLALGIITSPGHVEEALARARVDRDPATIAEKHVKVVTVGASSVLELSVSDRDRRSAAAIANALADRLVVLRTEAVTGDLEQLLADVTVQIDALGQQIESLATQVSDAEILSVPSRALQLRYEEVVRHRNSLEEQRQRLVESLGSLAKPMVIDRATAPVRPEPSGLPARMAVGGLLGLALGLAVATGLEALRPTIMSPDALARILQAPVLGRLPRAPQQDIGLRDPWLPDCLRLAANEVGASNVRLVGVGPPVDLHRLAGWLADGPDRSLSIEVVESRPVEPRLSAWLRVRRQRSNGFDGAKQRGRITLLRETNPGATGIVVVAPDVLRRDDLEVLEHRLAVTGWPLLGLITYRRRLFRHAVAGPTFDPRQMGEPAAARAALPAG